VLRYPPDNVNAGMLLLKPNRDMHAEFIKAVAGLEGYDNSEMGQGVLRSKNGFAVDGAFPDKLLPPLSRYETHC
jgi:inositol 3-alpha-galactosyltransferase